MERPSISMLLLSSLLLLTGAFEVQAYVKEWCRAVPEAGKPEYAICQQGGKTEADYRIEIVPVVAPGIDLQSDVDIVLSGTAGKATKPIQIASEAIGTEKRIFAEALDVGDCENVQVMLKSAKTWKCQRITVWKDFRYWVFDCTGTLNAKTPEAKYEISGNKLYEASVQTGNDVEAGTHGGIELSLVGKEKAASPKLLKQGFHPATQKKIRFRAAEVGDLVGMILTNTAEDDPWYCDYIRIMAEDGKVYPFTVKRWIGAPYDPTVDVTLQPSKMVDLPAQDIECHTRAADMFSRIPEEPQSFKVRCPMNCQSSEFAHVEGSSIHPASTSICAAAILDGIVSPSGGELVVTVVGPVPQYSGKKSQTGVDSTDYVPAPDTPTFSFYMYQSDSIDAIDTNVRVVDAYGKLAAAGRLEVRRNGTWGSVCKKGDFAEITIDTARKACQELGYLHGILLEDGCSFVNGQNVCAGKGYPVAVTGIMCNGAEKSLADCTFEEPTEFCKDHVNDAAVQCTNNPPDREPEPGTLRLVDASGAPTQTGVGRLEFYHDGFGSVCSDGWTKESERVACLEMGYSGLKSGGNSQDACSDVMGVNYCGSTKQKISIVNVACQGNEPTMRQCPHETNNDIYCVHEEDVVIGCEGNGDPSGIGLFTKEDLPRIVKRPFAPKLELQCGDRPINKPELKGMPGAMFLGTCPEGCSEEPGSLKGTFIYSDDSPICKAAIHAGIVGEEGGDIVVTLGHGQESFSGNERHEISSESFGPYLRTFTVSFPVSSVRARTAAEAEGQETKQKEARFAGESALPSGGTASFPSFRQAQSTEDNDKSGETASRDNFHWFAPEDWRGFRGKKGDYIDASTLPGGDLITSFKDFTFAANARLTGGQGTWRSILDDGECDGFQLAIDDHNELVFEQTCRPTFVQTGFKPPLNEWFHVAVTYFQPEKVVSVYVNGERVSVANAPSDFILKTHLTIGSSESESEYFIGDITAVQGFDYVLSPEEVKQVMKSASTSPGEASSASRNERRTTDGRLCLTPCSAEEPAALNVEAGAHPTNVAIALSCHDTLNLDDFNGKTGQKFRVSCPEDCMHEEAAVKGSRVFTADSSICRGALHAGVLSRQGGEATVILHNGLAKYYGTPGHGGIVSLDECSPQLRSFSICKAPRLKTLRCADDGAFVMKLGLGERELVICPPGCAKETDFLVYGTDLYSPASSVCRAALHAGILTDEGGETEIKGEPKQEAFVGSKRHNIESGKSGNYLRSFSFVTPKKSNHTEAEEL